MSEQKSAASELSAFYVIQGVNKGYESYMHDHADFPYRRVVTGDRSLEVVRTIVTAFGARADLHVEAFMPRREDARTVAKEKRMAWDQLHLQATKLGLSLPVSSEEKEEEEKKAKDSPEQLSLFFVRFKRPTTRELGYEFSEFVCDTTLVWGDAIESVQRSFPGAHVAAYGVGSLGFEPLEHFGRERLLPLLDAAETDIVRATAGLHAALQKKERLSALIKS